MGIKCFYLTVNNDTLQAAGYGKTIYACGKNPMADYPVFLNLKGRKVVLLGAGAVAVRKARRLLAAGVRLTVVSEQSNALMAEIAKNKNVELIIAGYDINYLTGAVLVIAATNDSQINRKIYNHCQKLKILCNVVDEPQLCDFIVPAEVKRGKLQIAVSTGGGCPAYASHLRKKLEAVFTDKEGKFLDELESFRKLVIEKINNAQQRKVLLGRLVDEESFEYFNRNGAGKWRQMAEKIMGESPVQD